MRKDTRNRLIARLYLALQIAIPLGGWIVGSPYFGWRMFSEVRVPPRLIVTSVTSTDTMSVNQFLGFPRGDLSYSQDVGLQLCRLIPAAITVRVAPAKSVLPSPGVAQEVRCR